MRTNVYLFDAIPGLILQDKVEFVVVPISGTTLQREKGQKGQATSE
jgi:hypothetical protein